MVVNWHNITILITIISKYIEINFGYLTQKILKSNKWSPKYKNSDGFKKALNETYEWFKDEKNLNKYTNIKNYNI